MAAKDKERKFSKEISPGRPALPPEERRKPRAIKMTDAEWEEIQHRAAQENISAAEYIRRKTLAGD